MERNEKPGELVVVRASAGSGKTFRLTEEYLLKIFEKAKHPQDKTPHYRSVLGVTFTNKATEEMKNRVVKELSKLSQGNGDHRRAIKARRAEIGCVWSDEEITQYSRWLLGKMLFDYGRFELKTIDGFFQQVFRAFLFDLGLSERIGLELDHDTALMEAVDGLVDSVDSTKVRLRRALERVYWQNVENGKRWQIKRDLFEYVKNVGKTGNQDERIEDADIEEAENRMTKREREVKARRKEIAETALRIIEEKGLEVEDFAQKTKAFPKAFQRELEDKWSDTTLKTFLARCENDEKWEWGNNDNYWVKNANTDAGKRIKELYEEGYLKQLYFDLAETYSGDCGKEMATIAALKDDIRKYGLLRDVEKINREILKEEHAAILLSDTTQLLCEIVKSCCPSVPFIYERVGVRYENFLIDEFQDTSITQWETFKPLVEEALANGEACVVVGDVKQSIYRWREGDWRLLAEGLGNDFGDGMRVETLKANWRSCPMIVKWNNLIFPQLREIAETLVVRKAQELGRKEVGELYRAEVRNAYESLEQELPKHQEDYETSGHVKIEWIAKENEQGEKECEDERAMRRMVEEIKNLQDRGYEAKDIAILVRITRECGEVAQRLLAEQAKPENEKYNFKVVSESTVTVGADCRVRLLVEMMRCEIHRGEEDENASTYEKIAGCLLWQLEHGGDAETENFWGTEQVELWQERVSEILRETQYLSFYERVEEWIGHLERYGRSADDVVYVQTFRDILFDYIRKKGVDMKQFVKYWDDKGNKMTISIPSGENAIRINTIHKSKGLEYEVVFMPFCKRGWDETKSNENYIWTHPEWEGLKGRENVFGNLGETAIPIKYGKSGKTFFDKEYLREYVSIKVDQLNLMYVTFTRAKRELYVYLSKKDSIGEDIKNMLSQDFCEKNGIEQTGDSVWEMGVSVPKEQKKDESTGHEEWKLEERQFALQNRNIHVKLADNVFGTHRARSVAHGNLLHGMLAKIEREGDVERTIKMARLKGRLEEQDEEHVRQELNKVMDLCREEKFFDGKTYDVVMERDMMEWKGEQGETSAIKVYRPDRMMLDRKNKKVIVLDYKFGEQKESVHGNQVKQYMRMMEKLGYKAEGRLLYVKEGKMVKVG